MLQMVANTVGSQNDVTFADFWALYPKRAAVRDAERAWRKLTPAEQVDAVVALAEWRKVWLARDEMQFTPYPATWLNGGRWMDDLPADAKSTHASQVAFAAKPAVDSGLRVVPTHVLEMIAKLRK